MESVAVWTLIAVLTLISFASRASFILLFSRVTLPRSVQLGLRFVPAAVFPALVAPDLFLRSGVLDLGLSNPKAAAAVAAGIVAWKSRNTLLTILVGMVILHLLQVPLIG